MMENDMYLRACTTGSSSKRTQQHKPQDEQRATGRRLVGL